MHASLLLEAHTSTNHLPRHYRCRNPFLCCSATQSNTPTAGKAPPGLWYWLRLAQGTTAGHAWPLACSNKSTHHCNQHLTLLCQTGRGLQYHHLSPSSLAFRHVPCSNTATHHLHQAPYCAANETQAVICHSQHQHTIAACHAHKSLCTFFKCKMAASTLLCQAACHSLALTQHCTQQNTGIASQTRG